MCERILVLGRNEERLSQLIVPMKHVLYVRHFHNNDVITNALKKTGLFRFQGFLWASKYKLLFIAGENEH